MKELTKGDIILIVIAVIVMIAIWFIYPYTYMGKRSYEANREKAIDYIATTLANLRYDVNPDSGYREEIKRLIDKFHLEGIFDVQLSGGNPLEEMLHENR